MPLSEDWRKCFSRASSDRPWSSMGRPQRRRWADWKTWSDLTYVGSSTVRPLPIAASEPGSEYSGSPGNAGPSRAETAGASRPAIHRFPFFHTSIRGFAGIRARPAPGRDAIRFAREYAASSHRLLFGWYNSHRFGWLESGIALLYCDYTIRTNFLWLEKKEAFLCSFSKA